MLHNLQGGLFYDVMMRWVCQNDIFALYNMWTVPHLRRYRSTTLCLLQFWAYNRARWSSNAHSVKQYAMCIRDRLRNEYNLTTIQLYFDVWCSLNGRFQQRFALLHLLRWPRLAESVMFRSGIRLSLYLFARLSVPSFSGTR